MRHHMRSLTWRDQAFRFERLQAGSDDDNTQWAVIRRGEFIGIMPCAPEVTTGEFDMRCRRWIQDLLDATG
jgi:hypothetical protein